ncbi:MAG: hypothetical protein NW226_10160 [Microscillaceae bacterium]|nr:hypothetical protein [Microscillaceae bacterium]
MKLKTLIFGLFILTSSQLRAQTGVDSLFSNNQVLLVQVVEITPEAVKYTYPGEEVINSMYKNAVDKIVFKSGRVQVFQEATSFKTVAGPQDWENVSLARVESEVKGLFKLEEVSSKAKGTTPLANVNKVKDRAYKKLKMEAAMLGANVVYVFNEDVEGNRFYDESGNPAETSISGIAYTSKLPSIQDFEKMIGENSDFIFAQKLYLGNNNVEIQAEVIAPGRVRIEEVIHEQGLIFVKTRILGEKSDRFRVIQFDEKQVTLMYRDKNKIYNLVLRR